MRDCAASALVLVSLWGAVAMGEPDPYNGETLRTRAEARGFLIGAAVNEPRLRDDAAYRELVAREYNIVTSEARMKFGPIQPVRGQFHWEDADTLVEYAEEHGMVVHGHTFLWHGQLPDWLKGDVSFSREEMEGIIRTFITTYMGRYKGRIAIWDVVNEAYEPLNVAADGYRHATPFYQAIGPEYLAMAFRIAHEVDPEATLVYNDFGIETVNPKSDVVYDKLKAMIADGVPVHGLGIQFHLGVNAPLDPDFIPSFEKNMQRFADLGLKLYITELDLNTGGENTPAVFERQGRAYGAILAAALRQPACRALQVWGVSDQNSWLSWAAEPKNVPKDPLLLDRDGKPKPGYHAFMREMANEPAPDVPE